MLNQKLFLVAFLSLCALIMFSAAAGIVINSCISSNSHMPSATYSIAALGFKPCGDPIDTPVFPGSANSTG
jgi:hypothetical protein